tara:strand:- start:1281 stop:1553 length:273 start_codon:yes stop_codon:yes gene_type:complete
MKTRAQELGISIPHREYDSKGNTIYEEYSNGAWYKYKYDSKGNTTHYEDSRGNWYGKKFDNEGHVTYRENHGGHRTYMIGVEKDLIMRVI